MATSGSGAEVIPLRNLLPGCPDALERLVHRALNSSRPLRYQSFEPIQFDAGQILKELQRGRAAQRREENYFTVAVEEPEPKAESRMLEPAPVEADQSSKEELDFYHRSREKAQALLQEEQFEQAADLLRNLQSLFPDDEFLQNDLQLALRACAEAAPDPPAEPEESAGAGVPQTFIIAAASHPPRRALSMAAGTLLILAAIITAAWKFTPPSQNDQAHGPRLLDGPQPGVPEIARQRGVYGVVTLEAAIDESGKVSDVNVITGPDLLASAAREAVMKWRFAAATRDGHAVQSTLPIQVKFDQKP
jgi:TonB family protein